MDLQFRRTLVPMGPAILFVRVSAHVPFSTHRRTWKSRAVAPRTAWSNFVLLTSFFLAPILWSGSHVPAVAAHPTRDSSAAAASVDGGLNASEPGSVRLPSTGLSKGGEVEDKKEVTTGESAPALGEDGAGLEERDVTEGVAKLRVMKSHAANLTDR